MTVDVSGTPVSDTSPAIIKVPNSAAYYKVTLTAPNGAQWTKKLEVKPYMSTDIRIVHTPDDSTGSAPANKPKRIGWINNESGGCNVRWPMKFDFVDADGKSIATGTVAHGYRREMSVPDGKYDVRMNSRQSTKDEWAGGKAAISGDGWKVTGGCSNVGPGVWFEK